MVSSTFPANPECCHERYTPSCQRKRLYVLCFWVICCKNIHECCRMTQNVWQTDLMYRNTAQKCVLFNSGEIIWISWVLCPCFIMHIVEAAAKSRRKIRQTTRVPGSLEISLVWAVTHAARRHTAHTHTQPVYCQSGNSSDGCFWLKRTVIIPELRLVQCKVSVKSRSSRTAAIRVSDCTTAGQWTFASDNIM